MEECLILQSGVGDCGCSVRVSCFMKSGIVNCSFAHSSQCSRGRVPQLVSPDSFPPSLFPFDNYCNMKQACDACEKAPAPRGYQLEICFQMERHHARGAQQIAMMIR